VFHGGKHLVDVLDAVVRCTVCTADSSQLCRGGGEWMGRSELDAQKKKPSRHIPPAREEFCSLRWTRIDLLDLLDRRCLSRETVSIEQEHERAVNIDACVDVA